MQQWRKNVYVLWLAVFVASICWTMVMPFTPNYLKQLGQETGTEFWSGVIIAVSSLCSMVMAPIWGAIGDRYGRRMMMLRAGSFLTIGYALMAIVRSPMQLLGVRVMIGLLTGFVPMAIALVGVSTPHSEVGQALGMIQTAWPSGSIIGPVVGGVLADWIGIRGASWISAAGIASMTALVFLMVREEFSAPAAEKKNLVEDLRVAVTHKVLASIVLITAAAQAAVMALEPVVVPFVQELAGPGAPSWLSGFLYSVPGVAFILMAGWWARRGQKVGYARTTAEGMVGSALLYLLQAPVVSTWQFGALRLLSGVAGAAVGPGVAALLATTIPKDLRGRAFGLNQAASSLGSIVGPLLGGYIGDYMNDRGVLLLAGLLYFIGWVWIVRVVQPRTRDLVLTE